MLRELRIREYAIVGKLDIEFPPGLVALTGETGAGKSILVGALGLALGGKAHADQRRRGAAETVVEARFSGPFRPSVKRRIAAAGIGGDDELLLRRVLPREGRSRAYVNDTAVSRATLEEIGRELVDIHGQHQHQSLLRPETHLDFLDGFGGLLDDRRAYREAYLDCVELLRERAAIDRREREKTERLDFLRFQAGEIEAAGLSPGEEEALREERDRLAHAGRLAEAAREAAALLYDGEAPAAAAVDRAARSLEEARRFDPGLEPLCAQLRECLLFVEEAGREIADYGGRIEADPGRLEEVEERLAAIGRLKRKYGDSAEAVIDRLGEVRREIDALLSGEERRRELDGAIGERREEVLKRAASLTAARRRAARRLEKRIVGELSRLGLRGARFEVSLPGREAVPGGEPVAALDEAGAESAEFHFSANVGEDPRPLARVASGGELSRVMLAVKSALAEVDQVTTLVFDEVDIGIGGRVARIVGERMKMIAAARQVLCVTHLPQIASLADAHYNIRKSSRGGRPQVAVTALAGAGRVEEIARMAGGGSVTPAARSHARDLLGEG